MVTVAYQFLAYQFTVSFLSDSIGVEPCVGLVYDPCTGRAKKVNP